MVITNSAPCIIFNPYITDARSHAVDYYLQSDNLEQLAEGYYQLEDFDKLKGLLNSVPDNHTLLEVRGVAIGMS